MNPIQKINYNNIWSLGICMFDIFYGNYPFGNSAHDVIEIYKEVNKNENF